MLDIFVSTWVSLYPLFTRNKYVSALNSSCNGAKSSRLSLLTTSFVSSLSFSSTSSLSLASLSLASLSLLLESLITLLHSNFPSMSNEFQSIFFSSTSFRREFIPAEDYLITSSFHYYLLSFFSCSLHALSMIFLPGGLPRLFLTDDISSNISS